MIDHAIHKLVAYALSTGLIEPCDETWAVNTLLEALGLASYSKPQGEPGEISLDTVLAELTDDAHARGVLPEDSITYRDLFDTMLMGRLTPRPSQVAAQFTARYTVNPRSATDWYYQFSQNTNYIRRSRISKDVKWVTSTEYGTMDITINLSKPEKDPKAIAAARSLSPSAYPRCQLCAENEGYAGRLDHPARGNHRMVPITINGSPWFLQYSPYVYYNEHCICLNAEHTPMKIDRACFAKLLDFVAQFPHYFVGSNADLPIVGGSILAHDHFQGGRYRFAMEMAPIETAVSFHGFEDVTAGIVKWPMSVIRIGGSDAERLVELADRILTSWRGYTDADAVIFAQTDGEPHNTITPIARMRDETFELDLVLRNNLTTLEHPLGLYHPHAELHHIKKENIGLIEVMGLAVLPARLKEELDAVADCLACGGSLRADTRTAKHADWAEEFQGRYAITRENVRDIVQAETGHVFAKVLEHAGVYRRNETGKAAFLKFIEQVKVDAED
jgi:galactose-1-phosphate uridylyltransferase family 2